MAVNRTRLDVHGTVAAVRTTNSSDVVTAVVTVRWVVKLLMRSIRVVGVGQLFKAYMIQSPRPG
jgi:hypothetical protein